jgi:hydrogenase expression/formation protein HypC
MCLGIPMKITAINQFMAHCEAKGVYRDVSLFLLHDNMPKIGNFVVVHKGYAIEKMSASEAQSAWEILDQVIEAENKIQNSAQYKE